MTVHHRPLPPPRSDGLLPSRSPFVHATTSNNNDNNNNNGDRNVDVDGIVDDGSVGMSGRPNDPLTNTNETTMTQDTALRCDATSQQGVSQEGVLHQDLPQQGVSQHGISPQDASISDTNLLADPTTHIVTADAVTTDVVTDESTADGVLSGCCNNATITEGLLPSQAAVLIDTDLPIISDTSLHPTTISTATLAASTPTLAAATPAASTPVSASIGEGPGLQPSPAPLSRGSVDYSPMATGSTISDRKKTFSFTPSPNAGMKGQGSGQGQKVVSGGKSGKSFLTNVGKANYCPRYVDRDDAINLYFPIANFLPLVLTSLPLSLVSCCGWIVNARCNKVIFKAEEIVGAGKQHPAQSITHHL